MGAVRDWTNAGLNFALVTGDVQYRVEADGLVRWRGIATIQESGVGVSGLTVGIFFAPDAQPAVGYFPSYLDWTGSPANRNFHWSQGFLYVGYFNAAGTEINMAGLTFYTTPLPEPVLAHTLENVIAGLADALRNIVGLHVYDFPSDRVEPPAAVLSRPETPYDVTLGGRSDEWVFPLWILTAKADDKAAYAEMLPYMEAEGPKSIRAMIEADRTLGGACDTAAVIRARPLFATVGGTEFLAVEFTLEVYT